MMKTKNLFILFFVTIVFVAQLLAGKKDTNISPADKVIDIAKKYIGVPYKYGSINPKEGFDCSGFIFKVMHEAGIKVPRASKGYANFGEKVAIENAKKGDIIVFTGSNPKEKTIGHVGILLKNNDGKIQFIHASSSKKHPGVVISDFASTAYQKRFIGVRRVL